MVCESVDSSVAATPAGGELVVGPEHWVREAMQEDVRGRMRMAIPRDRTFGPTSGVEAKPAPRETGLEAGRKLTQSSCTRLQGA